MPKRNLRRSLATYPLTLKEDSVYEFKKPPHTNLKNGDFVEIYASPSSSSEKPRVLIKYAIGRVMDTSDDAVSVQLPIKRIPQNTSLSVSLPIVKRTHMRDVDSGYRVLNTLSRIISIPAKACKKNDHL